MRTFADTELASKIVELAKAGNSFQSISEQLDILPSYVQALLQGQVPAHVHLVQGMPMQVEKWESLSKVDLDTLDFKDSLLAVLQGYTTWELVAKDLGTTSYRLKQAANKRYPKLVGKELPPNLLKDLMEGERTIRSVSEELNWSWNEVRKCLPTDFNPPRRNILQIPEEEFQLKLMGKQTLRDIQAKYHVGYVTVLNRYRVYKAKADPVVMLEAAQKKNANLMEALGICMGIIADGKISKKQQKVVEQFKQLLEDSDEV